MPIRNDSNDAVYHLSFNLKMFISAIIVIIIIIIIIFIVELTERATVYT